MELALIILGVAIVLIIGIGLFAHSPRKMADEAAKEAAQETPDELRRAYHPETPAERLKRNELLAEEDNDPL